MRMRERRKRNRPVSCSCSCCVVKMSYDSVAGRAVDNARPSWILLFSVVVVVIQ